ERFRPPFPTQRAARSAVGLTAERQLLFVTAGKGEEDTGITLGEMAVLMQQLGSQQALNLDGGTSSTLYVGDRVVNFNGRPPRVHNYLGIFRN
ncbi:MAG: phosphodiester glycosidase family protein, partial [Cyanobacteria bacterium P01_E01_bin.34]